MVGEKHIWSKSLDENNGDEGSMSGGIFECCDHSIEGA